MNRLENIPAGESIKDLNPDGVKCFTTSISKTRFEDSGDKAAVENQDKVLNAPKQKALAVFDGVGGYKNGAEAASRANEVINTNLTSIPDSIEDTKTEVDGIKNRIKQIFKRAHESILSMLDGEQGATTVAFVKLVKVGNREQAVVAHVGDSRVYRYNPRTGLTPLTIDDAANRYNSIDEQTAVGNITYRPDDRLDQEDPAVEQANRYLTNRNTITSALGGKYLGVHVQLVPVEAGDVFITVTDGVTDNLTEVQIRTIIANTPKKDIARVLAQRSFYGANLKAFKTNRSKSDDITTGVMETGTDPESYSDVADYIGEKYPDFFKNQQAAKSFRNYINSEENDSKTRAEAAKDIINACNGNEEQLTEISSYAERLHAKRIELLSENDPIDGVVGLRDLSDRLKLLGPTLVPVKRDKWRGHEIVDLSIYSGIVEQIMGEPDYERVNTLVAKLPSQFNIRDIATLIARDVTSDRRMSNFSSEQTKPNITRII